MTPAPDRERIEQYPAITDGLYQARIIREPEEQVAVLLGSVVVDLHVEGIRVLAEWQKREVVIARAGRIN